MFIWTPKSALRSRDEVAASWRYSVSFCFVGATGPLTARFEAATNVAVIQPDFGKYAADQHGSAARLIREPYCIPQTFTRFGVSKRENAICFILTPRQSREPTADQVSTA
jgi:hypothetical protein